MINIKPTVVAALKADATLTGLLGGQRVYFQVSPNADEYPRITYYELDNSGALFADDVEQASEIVIMVDVWSKTSTSAIAQAVDNVMTGLGFEREAAPDLYENDTKVHHKAIRYGIEKEI